MPSEREQSHTESTQVFTTLSEKLIKRLINTAELMHANNIVLSRSLQLQFGFDYIAVELLFFSRITN